MSVLAEIGNVFCEDKYIIDEWTRIVKKVNSWESSNVMETKLSSDLSEKDINFLTDKNNQLKYQLSNLVENIKIEKQKYYQLKNEQKELTEETKYLFDALKRAKKYYKNALKTYFSIVSNTDTEQVVYVQFFTDIKLSHDQFSVWLTRCKRTDEYRVSKMYPVLSTYRQIERTLEESKDVPAILCCIRQSFIKLKEDAARSK